MINAIKSLRRAAYVKRQSKASFRLFPFRGVKILCHESNKLENKLLSGEVYDRENFEVVAQFVKEGFTCLDVGGNIGIYSAVMSKIVGNTGSIIAFEPVDHIRRKFKANQVVNGARNINVYPVGLGSERGQFEMFQVNEGEFRAGTSTFMRNNNVQDMGEDKFTVSTVEVYRLDDFLEKEKVQSKIDFIKVDIEGFELNFLLGAKRVLSKDRPVVLIEHHKERIEKLGIKESDYKILWKDCGYSCFEPIIKDDFLHLHPYDFDRKMLGINLVCLPVD